MVAKPPIHLGCFHNFDISRMPPRLSKRQQREQDEIAALATTSLEHQALASKALEDADSSKVTQKSTAAFSLLADEIGSESDDDHEAPAATKKKVC